MTSEIWARVLRRLKGLTLGEYRSKSVAFTLFPFRYYLRTERKSEKYEFTCGIIILFMGPFAATHSAGVKELK